MKTTKYPVATYDSSSEDEFAYEDFKITLAPIVEKIFTTGYVKCSAENMGWRRVSGYKVFIFDPQVRTVSDFLSNFMPDTDWSCQVFRAVNGHGLYFNVTHHDNPVSGDEYYLTPISENTYNRLH